MCKHSLVHVYTSLIIDVFLLAHLQLLDNLQVQLVVKTQWVLFVELHQFRNLYNAEVISGGGFCCCDNPPTPHNYMYHYCTDGEAKSLSGCSPSCDTWLNASVSHCTDPNPCSFSTEVLSQTASIDNFNEKFIFALNSSSCEVRIAKCLCNLH